MALAFRRMQGADRAQAMQVLGAFLGADPHYRASSAAYGDGGRGALERALDLFIERPEIGFVWLALDERGEALGACVVCRAISTSRGTLVAKLDDVSVRADALDRGVGTSMLE